MADDVVPAAPATSPEPAAVILPDGPPVADNLPMKPRMATLATEADYSRAATDEKSTPPPRMLPAADRARIACSLLSSFDFAGKGSVSHEDWLRGISLIALWDGDSAVWQRLSTQFGDGATQASDTATIDLAGPWLSLRLPRALSRTRRRTRRRPRRPLRRRVDRLRRLQRAELGGLCR